MGRMITAGAATVFLSLLLLALASNCEGPRKDGPVVTPKPIPAPTVSMEEIAFNLSVYAVPVIPGK